MKKIFIIILWSIPLTLFAQKPTAAEEQAAWQCAKQFCDLLVRFSEGERTIDGEINALCSGADCSAFDDIKSNKEVTLRNYLMSIQRQYPKTLEMTITPPSLSNSMCYVEPLMSIDTEWQNHSSSDLSMTEGVSLSTIGINNFYIVFDVLQKYPSLNKSMHKKIVYDVNARKITAFINNQGAYINFLNGLLEFSKGDYLAAMNNFDSAAQNDRSSLKKGCYGLAFLCALYIDNIDKAIEYADLMGDPLYIAMSKMQYYTEHNDFEGAYKYAKEFESLLNKITDLPVRTRSEGYLLLANMYLNPLTSYQDVPKALSFLTMAEKLGNERGGYMIYVYYYLLNDESLISAETAYRKLGESAIAGYPPAIYMWGYNLERINKEDEAFKWYEKAAEFGNHRAMAAVGKRLIEKGERNRGMEYLKNSLKGNVLVAELEDMDLTYGFRPIWPESRSDVESYLNDVLIETQNAAASSLNNYPSSSNTSVSSESGSAASDNSTTSAYNSNNIYNASHYSGHHSFNMAKEDTSGGFSFGYVQKKWRYHASDYKEGVNVFGEDKPTKGIQVGIRINPQFGYGFGINTGLFYEYYFDRSEDMYEDELEYHFTAEEHSLYMPIHFKYSLNFSKWFQLAFYGGLGLDYGLKGKIYMRCDGETLTSIKMYDDELDMKRFNTSLEYGAAVRINHFQLNLTMSKGLVNMSGNEDYKVKLDKLFNISATFYL